MRQFFIAFLIIAAVLVGGSVVANVAYQTGVQVAVTTAAANAPEGTVVTPVAPAYGYGHGYGYGPGWHGGPGFGIFGILFGIFFIFLIFGLLRAAFGAGRGWGGPGGWGGRGGPGGWGHEHNGERPWERQARELHDSWHRDHPGESGGSSTDRPSTGASGA